MKNRSYSYARPLDTESKPVRRATNPEVSIMPSPTRAIAVLHMQQMRGNQSVLRALQDNPSKITNAGTVQRGIGSMLDYVNPRYHAPTWLGGYSKPQMKEYTAPPNIPTQLVNDFKAAFTVIDDGAQKQRPNQVYLDEYNATATLIGDIYNRTTKIRITINNMDNPSDPVADQSILDASMRDLITIAQTVTGRSLLNKIARAAVDAPRVVLEVFDIVYAPAANPLDANLPNNKPKASTVTYTPTAYKNGLASNSADNKEHMEQAQENNPWLMPDRSDVTLYHELVHAYHMQLGIAKEKTALVGQDDDDGMDVPSVDDVDEPYNAEGIGGEEALKGVSHEEYYTVGLGAYKKESYTENKYRKERRSMGEDVPARTQYTTKDQYGNRGA